MVSPSWYEAERPERATAEAAARVVHLLLSSFPHEAKNAEVYARQLIDVCTGVDMDALREMVNPRTGLVSTAKFLPSVAEVIEFLHAQMNAPKFAERWNRLAIEDKRRAEKDVEVSPEEHARVSQGFADLLARLKQTSVKHRPAYVPGQSLTPEQNAALDAYIADPNTPDLPDRAQPIGSVALDLAKDEAA